MCSYDSCSDASAVVETSGQYQQYLSDCFARTSGVHRACLLQQTTPVAWASARASLTRRTKPVAWASAHARPALHTRTPQRFFGMRPAGKTDYRRQGIPVPQLARRNSCFVPFTSLVFQIRSFPATRQLTPKARPGTTEHQLGEAHPPAFGSARVSRSQGIRRKPTAH